jgi:glyoxylase-like metal-dependent hydrolase (beta-lactamase superfamily II)
MKTPGHSRGGVVFYSEDEHIIFTGDTLFKMSVGRTDFDGGSYAELMNSLQTILAPLPPETTIFSGHGPKTTIGEELRYNPYLQ